VRGLLLSALCFAACSPQPLEHEITLWAWERPEDLRFLAPGDARVAFLANRIVLRGEEIEVFPRRVPLRVRPGVELMPVVRIEAHGAALDAEQLENVVEAVGSIPWDPGLEGLQIDFDAKESERGFYRELLARLSESYSPLSMTALVSWCDEPEWLDSLAADEVVPMLFHMGRGSGRYAERLRRDGRFRAERCNQALGQSTDEGYPWAPQREATYWFRVEPWTEEAFRSLPGVQRD